MGSKIVVSIEGRVSMEWWYPGTAVLLISLRGTTLHQFWLEAAQHDQDDFEHANNSWWLWRGLIYFRIDNQYTAEKGIQSASFKTRMAVAKKQLSIE